MSKQKHYVDNVRFQELLVERRKQIDSGETPPISNELGSIFIKIASNLCYRHNFIGSHNHDDMSGDAIETCIRYVDCYDALTYSNPFAYFTQLCYFTFLRRIKKEKAFSDTVESVREHEVVMQDFHDSYDFRLAVSDCEWREGEA